MFGLLMGSVTRIAFSKYEDCPTLVYRLVLINVALLVSVANLMYLRSRSTSLSEGILCKKIITLIVAALTALGSMVQSGLLLNEYIIGGGGSGSEGGGEGEGEGVGVCNDSFIYLNQIITAAFGFIVPISILAAIVWIVYIR